MVQFTRSDFSKGRISQKETLKTITVIVFFLFALEHSTRFFVNLFKDSTPVLANETNRKILSRHLAVDFLCCAAVSWLGWNSRNELGECGGIVVMMRSRELKS